MDQTRRDQLELLGMDVDATLKRFMGQENLLIKFLKKFREDETMQELQKALDASDWERAFRCAHTLKGLSANLGLVKLMIAASELTELLRNLSFDESELAFCRAMVEEEIKEVLEVTETL